jgi:hypothetical protein
MKKIVKKPKKIFNILIYLIIFLSFKLFGQTNINDNPNIFDERFTRLISDFKYNTDFYYLVDSKENNTVSVWLKISLPIIYAHNFKGDKIKKGGGYELVHYKIGCVNKEAQEFRRITTDEFGIVEKVLFNYPEGNKSSIIPYSFLDLLRVNACDLN